jgi:thiol peroxidase
MERQGVVTFKGNPLTLLGNEAVVGQKAGDFKALDKELSEKTLGSFKDKIKLIAAVPSLDTPVCDTEIKRFNDEAASISKDVAVIFISMDLPFAQKRFCQESNIKKVQTLSDHREADFGINYGVLIKGLRLLARAIFIVDKNDIVRYVEYVRELGNPPDYDAALRALKSLISQV